MGETTGKLKDTWRTLGPRGQLGVAASGLLVLITLFFLFQMAGKASYTTLTSGLQASESAQIAKALDAAGIKYQLKSGGTEVDVLSGTESKARIALAAKNLPNGGHVGFELFDKKSLGQTDFQQKVQYQRALEGEIARTIEQIDGVRGVDVQLVIPDDALFLADATKATASVLVTGGTALDASTISGIAHLVSSAVKGLAADGVTITDETGSLLWPRTGGAGGENGPQLKLEAEQRYASQLSSQINAMLATTLGVNKAQVRIHADLNVDQATLDKVTYAAKGTPLTSKTDQELLKSAGASPSTPAGTASNVPGYATTPAGQNASSNYTHLTSTTDFGVDKTVSHTVVSPGSVNRLNVALMVDASIPATQVAALQKSVAAMAGVDPTRGDTLAVTTLAFAAPLKAAPPAATGGLPIPAAMLGMLKWVGILLGSGVFFFFLRKNLKRREGEGVALEPTWLREIERTVPVGLLDAGPVPLEIAVDPEGERRHQLKTQVQDLVRTNPEQIAMQVNQWLREG